jgi:hypothetical protein
VKKGAASNRLRLGLTARGAQTSPPVLLSARPSGGKAEISEVCEILSVQTWRRTLIGLRRERKLRSEYGKDALKLGRIDNNGSSAGLRPCTNGVVNWNLGIPTTEYGDKRLPVVPGAGQGIQRKAVCIGLHILYPIS